MRSFLALAALALLGASTPLSAIAAPADCAGISDSLIRLRCYDDAAKPSIAKTPETKPSAPVAAKRKKPNFDAYALPVLYSGPIRTPDFRGRDKDFALFRTRLRDGMKSGVNFAGSMAMVQIGCGTSCQVVYAGDVSTGKVYSFPLGGEDNYSLSLEYRPNSRLVVGQWENIDEDRCYQEQYLWTGGAFEKLSRTILGKREVCSEES